MREPVDELERVKQRVYTIHDMVTTHEAKLSAHEVLLKALTSGFEGIHTRMASKEQVEGMSRLMDQKFEGQKVEHSYLQHDVRMIRSVILWATGIIVSAVIVALLRLVVVGPQP